MKLFEEAWSHFHPGHLPIGYRLREGGAANWVRFHSLPGSKRYPDTDAERRTILERQGVLASEVLKTDPCWLVQTQWITPPGTKDVADVDDPFAATRLYGLKPAFQFTDGEDEDSSSWRVYAAPIRWIENAFDELLMSIAEHKAAPTLWMSEANGGIVAPYEGELIYFSPTLRRPRDSAAPTVPGCHLIRRVFDAPVDR